MYPPNHTAAPAVRAFASIADLLGSLLARHGDAVATRHDAGDRYVDTTYAEALANASALARWFLARPTPQQLVVTLCKNRPEWDMTALAVFHTANILCPLDITMNQGELEGLLSLRRPMSCWSAARSSRAPANSRLAWASAPNSSWPISIPATKTLGALRQSSCLVSSASGKSSPSIAAATRLLPARS